MKVHDTNHVADFHDLCPNKLSARGSFSESWRNGIWALPRLPCRPLSASGYIVLDSRFKLRNR